MSGDTVLIQDAMGEKVGKFIQLVSTFLGGFVIAFIKGCFLPLSCCHLFLSACDIRWSHVSSLIQDGISRQNAYAKAAIVVEQTIGSIRTEKKAVADYDKSLVKAYQSGVNEGGQVGLLYFIDSHYPLLFGFAKMI
ncbi:UNVERIFIED_CONTAM: ABC transporter B family member 4 [Sesamum latifolium]|uniref:ABC transporter B family member 4 n=1 Tax=Sesamum latifolium TaxID=2727402 RepID=A0AAW2XV85_9LAMI